MQGKTYDNKTRTIRKKLENKRDKATLLFQR